MKTNLYGDSYNRVPVGRISKDTLIDIKYHIYTQGEFRDGSVLINNVSGILTLTEPTGYSSNREGILGDTNVHLAPEIDPFNNDIINFVVDFVDGITNAIMDVYEIKNIEP